MYLMTTISTRVIGTHVDSCPKYPQREHIFFALLYYGVPADYAESASDLIAKGHVRIIGFSGKMGSGKDTVAPIVSDAVTRHSAKHLFFSVHLKNEVNDIIRLIGAGANLTETAGIVAREMGVSTDDADEVVGLLYDPVRKNPTLSAFDRTVVTRKVAQVWGTGVRRAQDENYWVDKAVVDIIRSIESYPDKGSLSPSNPLVVYITDARFPNEIDALVEIGAYAARLNVSPEQQRRRILSRDGLEVSDEQLSHLSETALDNYSFHAIVDTDKWSSARGVATELLRELVDYDRGWMMA